MGKGDIGECRRGRKPETKGRKGRQKGKGERESGKRRDDSKETKSSRLVWGMELHMFSE